MRRSYGHRIAVVLVAGVGVLLAGESQIAGRAYAQEAGQQQHEPGRDPLARAIGNLPSPYPDQERCESYEPANGPDICAQWVAAVAARRSAELAWWAIFWVVASVVVGGLSVVGTLWAAWAATQAAKAAQDSAKAMTRQEAPLLYLREVTEDAHGEMMFIVFNAGRTAAVVLESYVYIRVQADPPADADFKRGEAITVTIRPEMAEKVGEASPVTATGVIHEKFAAGEISHWQYGSMRYRTVFGDLIELRFCRVSHQYGPWMNDPDRHNYTRKLA